MTEAHRSAWTTRPLVAFLLAGLAIGGPASTARGDRISVRGGGQIKGKLIPDKAHPGQLLYIGEVGKTPMVFKKDQIIQVTPEKSALDEYVVRLAKERTTAEAEFELGAWCDQNKLADLAQVHYELTLKRDSTFEEAHKKLGHVLMGGRWLNADEVKEAQGMVKYRGRWVSPEEKERREMMAATAAEGNSWVKKLKLLRDGYLAGPDSRSKEAERRLMAIDEPAAIGPVLKVLGDDPIPVLRSLAARVLGVIPGPEASSALVGRLLGEEDQSVRQATMNELTRREASEVVPLLTRGLRSTLHQVVNRAAWALGNLNAVATVPKLIPVLITYEYEVVVVDGGPSGPGVGFNSGSGGAGFASYSNRAIPIVTPPVVGPGAVGYGATSIPTGPGVGSSIGGGSSSSGPTPKLLQVEFRNDEVLAALVKMTGCDFGYNIPAWQQWMTTSFKVEAKPSRRVREP
jgi:hypothetical protein